MRKEILGTRYFRAYDKVLFDKSMEGSEFRSESSSMPFEESKETIESGQFTKDEAYKILYHMHTMNNSVDIIGNDVYLIYHRYSISK